MHRLILRIVPLSMLMLVTFGFGPVTGTAQTPVDATPVPLSGVEVVTIGMTGIPSDAEGRLSDLNQPVHAVLEVTVEPGTALPDDYSIPSTVIQVTSGSIMVSVSEGVASVSVGSGLPIQAVNGAEVVCGDETCDLELGQEIVLGPGNGISLTESLFRAENLGDGPAVLQLSVLLPGTSLDDPLCWICPHITP